MDFLKKNVVWVAAGALILACYTYYQLFMKTSEAKTGDFQGSIGGTNPLPKQK